MRRLKNTQKKKNKSKHANEGTPINPALSPPPPTPAPPPPETGPVAAEEEGGAKRY